MNSGADGSTVTAVPDAGYHFVDWSDGVLTAARTDLNVTGDLTVTANFAIDTYTLTYTAGANGSESQSKPAGLAASFIGRDERTGQSFLKLPMPKPEVLDQALQAIGALLEGWSRTRA